MNTKILDQKGEEGYCVVIHDLRAGEDDTRKPAFNICVYDMEKSGDWNDYVAVTAADTEEKAREAMENFYREYYKDTERYGDNKEYKKVNKRRIAMLSKGIQTAIKGIKD